MPHKIVIHSSQGKNCECCGDDNQNPNICIRLVEVSCSLESHEECQQKRDRRNGNVKGDLNKPFFPAVEAK